MSKSPLILYSAPVLKVIPLTIGGRALCATSGYSTQSYEEDEEYDYGGLD